MEEINCCDQDIIETCAAKLKVCGHPLRLKILCVIEKEDSCVSDLWKCLGQPQPVVSQHLAVLKRRGIVSSSIDGNRRIYSIADPFVQHIIQSLDGKE